MMKATIINLEQTLLQGLVYQATLNLLAEDGRKIRFSVPLWATVEDTAEGLNARMQRDIKKGEDYGADIMHVFKMVAENGMFVPQVLHVAGVDSVDKLPGRQIMCSGYGEGKATCATGIASLDGQRSYDYIANHFKLDEVVADIEKAYESRGGEQRRLRAG